MDLTLVSVLKGLRRRAEQPSRVGRPHPPRSHAPKLGLRLIIPLVLPAPRPRRLTGYPPEPTLSRPRRHDLRQLDGRDRRLPVGGVVGEVGVARAPLADVDQDAVDEAAEEEEAYYAGADDDAYCLGCG